MVNYPSAVLDQTFGALSDATRRAMVQQLARGECTVMDLAKPFDMSLPAVTKHVRILEKAGILVRQKTGRTNRCQLQPKPLEDATQWIEHYRKFWEESFDRLDAYLKTVASKKKSKEKIP